MANRKEKYMTEKIWHFKKKSAKIGLTGVG